jgi:DNA replication protein DnaC
MKEYIEQLVRQSNSNDTKEAKDYELDGILYCHKCNTPKQKKLFFLGGRIVNIKCECEISEEKAKQQREHIQKVRDFCLPDKAMHKCNFANDDGSNPEIIEVAKKFVENFEEFKANGKGLLIYGNVGRGKTYASLCIANALIDKGKYCYVTSFPAITRALEGTYGKKDAFLNEMNSFDLVIIDDLAVERQSEYMQEIVHTVIDGRYQAKKPIIITTNLTADKLKKPQGTDDNRVFSRLFEMCLPFEVKGIHHRNKICAENKARFMENLNW